MNSLMTGKAGLRPLVLAGLLIPVLVYAAWQISRRFPAGIPGRAAASAIVRSDVVVGSKGKKYRRVVRVDRNAADKTVTTTVTFTDLKTGGVGVAAYVQPNLTPVQSYLGTNRRLDAFMFISGKRIGLTGPPLGRRFPVLSIPYPMEPGQKWTVRLIRTARGHHSEGSGKAPPGATLMSTYLLQNAPKADIYYGQGVSW